MSEIKAGDRVTGVFYGQPYTARVERIDPEFGYYLILDEMTPLGKRRVTIELSHHTWQINTTIQKEESSMTLYTYRLRNRPAMYGTVPDKRRVDLDSSDPLPYGTVTYERALTAREIYRFELIPMLPTPVLPLYPAGSTVRDMRNGKLYTVESLDGETWIRDGILHTIQDWLFFEPVLSASDYDYSWRDDNNSYPFDTVVYTSDPIEFPAEDNEIVTQYVDGMLQIIVNVTLDRRQGKRFECAVSFAKGVKAIERDDTAQFSSSYTAFVITINPKFIHDLESVRESVKEHARTWLANLQVAPVQPDLFSLEPQQQSMF